MKRKFEEIEIASLRICLYEAGLSPDNVLAVTNTPEKIAVLMAIRDGLKTMPEIVEVERVSPFWLSRFVKRLESLGAVTVSKPEKAWVEWRVKRAPKIVTLN